MKSKNLTILTLLFVALFFSSTLAKEKVVAKFTKSSNSQIELLRDNSRYSLKFTSKTSGAVHRYSLTPETAKKLTKLFQKSKKLCKTIPVGKSHREFVQLPEGKIHFSVANVQGPVKVKSKVKPQGDLAIVATSPKTQKFDESPVVYVGFSGNNPRARELESFFKRLNYVR